MISPAKTKIMIRETNLYNTANRARTKGCQIKDFPGWDSCGNKTQLVLL